MAVEATVDGPVRPDGARATLASRLAAGWRRLQPPADTDVRTRSRYLLAGIGVLSLVSLLGTVLTPALLDQPLLLVTLTPRAPFLVMAGRHDALAVVAIVGTARLMLGDPLHLLLGRRHGAHLVPARVRRWVDRLGLGAIALRPTSKVLMVAGAGGIAPRRALLVDFAATAVYVVGLAAVGSTFF